MSQSLTENKEKNIFPILFISVLKVQQNKFHRKQILGKMKQFFKTSWYFLKGSQAISQLNKLL